MKKGIDRCFMGYGIRQEDMAVIEQVCQSEDIDVEWFKEHVLLPYHNERSNDNLDEKKLRTIIKQAINKLPSNN